MPIMISKHCSTASTSDSISIRNSSNSSLVIDCRSLSMESASYQGAATAASSSARATVRAVKNRHRWGRMAAWRHAERNGATAAMYFVALHFELRREAAAHARRA